MAGANPPLGKFCCLGNRRFILVAKPQALAQESIFKRVPKSVNFNNGNPWKEIGTWSATAPSTNGTFTTLNDLHVWLGLKNSDDQSAHFDVSAELCKNSALFASGETTAFKASRTTRAMGSGSKKESRTCLPRFVQHHFIHRAPLSPARFCNSFHRLCARHTFFQ